MRRRKQFAIILLVFIVLFGVFGGTAFGASTRFALVTEVTGTVKVTKAGGSKEIRVFNGMGLNEGDKLKVEKGSSVTLKVADREDEVVLGENWSGALSKLKSNSSGGGDTAVKTWAGSMYNKVEKITGTSSTYKVETPTAVMGVRGTQFMVLIDPVTGLPVMFVSAGKVEAGDPEQQQSTLVLPSQQITLYPDADPSAGVGYVDPENLIQIADDEVIAALLKNKALIDEENDEILEELEGESENEGTLDLSDAEAFERYRSNVQNALFNVLRTAADNGTFPEEEVEEIINAANQAIQDAERQYDLDRQVPQIDRTAGVDAAAEAERQRQRQEAEQQRQQLLQQKEQKKQDITNNNAQLIQKIQQTAQELQQANQQAQEQKKQEAVDRVLENLSDAQRQALQQRLEEKKQQQEQQQQQQQQEVEQRQNQGQQPGNGTGNSNPASNTEVALSKSTMAYGETIEITATVTSGGSPVPNGGSVRFRAGTAEIGFASTTNGTAKLVLEGTSSQQLKPGTYSISAQYAGTSSIQNSTSFGKNLTVNKAGLSVTLDAPEIVYLGSGQVKAKAVVSAVSPGFGVPAGSAIKLYEENATAAVAEATVGSDGTAEFTINVPTGASKKKYKAEIAESANYLAAASSFKEISFEAPTSTSPKITLERVNTTGGFDVAVKLDNFTGAKRLYGIQLHFVTGKNLFQRELASGQTTFNGVKFNSAQTAESFHFFDGVIGTQPRREFVYAMTQFNTTAGVAFDENETMATLQFKIIGVDDFNAIDYVYAQVVTEDGLSTIPAVVEFTNVAY